MACTTATTMRFKLYTCAPDSLARGLYVYDETNMHKPENHYDTGQIVTVGPDQLREFNEITGERLSHITDQVITYTVHKMHGFERQTAWPVQWKEPFIAGCMYGWWYIKRIV